MKKLKTCVFSAIVILVISFRDEAESKPVEFPQEREISLKKEMEIVRRLKRYMEENDDFIEKFHSGKMSKRSNLDPNPRSKVDFKDPDPLDGPPPAKEAKKKKEEGERLGKGYKHDPHPPDGEQKIPSRNNGHAHNGHGNGGGMERTSTHKQLKNNDDFIEKSHSRKSLKRSNVPGPPSAKEAKKSENHENVHKMDPHPPISKRKLPDKHAQTKKKASRKPNLPTIPENRQNVAIWRRNRGLEHLSVKRKYLRIKRYRGPILTERTS